MADETKKGRKTLTEDAITSRRGMGRRALLLGALGGGAALATAGMATRAQALTDSDSGSGADPAGQGRGTGLTDSDSGSNADQAGNGRGTYAITDQDSGANADPAGRGRGPGGVRTGITDTDSGSSADQAGYGRG
ncbi:MAG: hypothetical protein H6900_14925 [Rhodobacter sp.]|uniref:hypothetical protein n=1 Tax=Pararhodobacter sp. TaxID=2127056 RepID=UPI001DF5E954|nr:hypothetical protein [Pararhodobacter sp.]MCB1346614.1 hypothetical protein [Paracoccaceae bacterium]MCC0074574.1 hypothetical protein [Rhodobacter sp.]HPD92521.1 hypothetical protein [Pararhodobacter sp.]